MRLRIVPQTLVLLAAAACAGGPAPLGASFAAPHRAGTSTRSVLTGDEMREARATNALDAVQRLRPEFMRSRGVSIRSLARPQLPGVFHNGIYLGSIEMLRTFSPLEVIAVRRLSPSDVTLRYGSRYGGMDGLEVVTVGTGRAYGR
jgi:hypothetical protein